MVLLLYVTNLLFVALGDESTTSTIAKKIGFLLLSFSYLILPLSAIKPKYYFGFLFLLYPFSFLDNFLIINHHNQSSVLHYITVLSTNSGETMELFSQFTSFVFISLLVLALYLFVYIKVVKDNFELPRIVRIIVGVFSLGFILLVGFRDYSNASKSITKLEGEQRNKAVFASTKKLIITKIEKSFPFGVVVKAIKTKTELEKLDNLLSGDIKEYSVENVNDSVKVDNIIFVIGESARRKNFGLYNYKRNTTPNLSKQGNLIVFDSLCTTANTTIASLTQTLSSVGVGNINQAYKEKGIYSLFSKANFQTTLISNQPYKVSSYIFAISKYADNFIDVSGNYEMANKYDEYLLDDLKKELNEDTTNKKKFVVLHTWGSHSRYTMRYTDEFKTFVPVPGDESNRFDRDAKLRDKVINSYDNSILYTDFILSQVIKDVDSLHQSSIVIYISDHGENLYDDERNLVIHTKQIPSKYELQVPMFIWYSDDYYKNNKRLIDNIELKKSNKLTSEVVFHTLGSLSGFESNFYNRKFDLTSDEKLSYKRLFYTVDNQVISTDSILEIENKIKPYFE